MILTIALSHNLTHGCRKRCETLRSITCFHLHFVALLKDQIIGLLTTPHFEEGTSELLACKYFDIGRSGSMDVAVQLCMQLSKIAKSTSIDV